MVIACPPTRPRIDRPQVIVFGHPQTIRSSAEVEIVLLLVRHFRFSDTLVLTRAVTSSYKSILQDSSIAVIPRKCHLNSRHTTMCLPQGDIESISSPTATLYSRCDTTRTIRLPRTDGFVPRWRTRSFVSTNIFFTGSRRTFNHYSSDPLRFLVMTHRDRQRRTLLC